MEGHLLAPLLEDNPPEPPFVALLVSGGHSMLVEVKAIGQYTILGDTLDDAAGEAFDKTAKIWACRTPAGRRWRNRPEAHTSELQALMRISYAVFCLNNKTHNNTETKEETK